MYSDDQHVAGVSWTRGIVLGILTLTIVAAVAFGGNYLWQKWFGPSQASAADCALAQTIIDQGKALTSDQAAAEEWARQMHDLRYSSMEDGYLGLQISRYEGMIIHQKTGLYDPVTEADARDMREQANSHCAKDLTFPPLP